MVAQASGAKMGVGLAAELRPAVVLMDLRLSDLDGIAVVREILEQDESMRVLALTTLAKESDMVVALDAGICGFLPKDSPIDDVVAAIRAAADGTAWLSSRAAQALLDSSSECNRAGYVTVPDHDLSPQEIELLQLLARGLDINDIATELSIGPGTAQNHLSGILSKLVASLGLVRSPRGA